MEEGTSGNVWKNTWIEICELGKQHGFETIVTLQPYLGTSNRVLTDEELKEIYDWPQTRPNYFGSFSEYEDQLKEIGEQCAASADFRKIYDDMAGLIYFDISHVRAPAMKVTAELCQDGHKGSTL